MIPPQQRTRKVVPVSRRRGTSRVRRCHARTTPVKSVAKLRRRVPSGSNGLPYTRSNRCRPIQGTSKIPRSLGRRPRVANQRALIAPLIGNHRPKLQRFQIKYAAATAAGGRRSAVECAAGRSDRPSIRAARSSTTTSANAPSRRARNSREQQAPRRQQSPARGGSPASVGTHERQGATRSRKKE